MLLKKCLWKDKKLPKENLGKYKITKFSRDFTQTSLNKQPEQALKALSKLASLSLLSQPHVYP